MRNGRMFQSNIVLPPAFLYYIIIIYQISQIQKVAAVGSESNPLLQTQQSRYIIFC